jgi:hypothetical protein
VKKRPVYYVFAVITIVMIVNCTSNKKTSNTDEDAMNVEFEKPKANKFERMFSAPSPEELMMLFEDTGLEFNSDVLNDPKNISNYISLKSLSCNLGVYVTDAAYLNMFEQYSKMASCLESIFKITDKLNLSGVLLKFDFEKVFREMDNPDSLIILSEGVYHAVTEYMVENENEQMLCLISHGSIVELLHLTIESVNEFNADDPVLQHISDQYMQLDNLMEFAQQYAGNADIEEMISQLALIQEVWGIVEHEETATVVSNNKDGELSISGGKKHRFTKEQFIKLKNTVNQIRTKITS